MDPQPSPHLPIDIPALMNRAHSGSDENVRSHMNPLHDIQGSPAHQLTLQLWEKEEETLQQRIERKETRCSNIQNEIYHLFGFYFLFQGIVLIALFTAAAQPSEHTCRYWWCPFMLSLIVSLGTISAVLNKSHDQATITLKLEEERARCSALFYKIAQLRREGTAFNLQQAPRERRNQTDSTKGKHFLRILTNVWSYTRAVTLVLVAFSGVTLASCRLLLCNDR